MSASVRMQVLKRLAGIVDPEHPEGAKARPRSVIAAARALLAADALNLRQEELERLRGTGQEETLADLVAEAEAAAAAHQPAQRPQETPK
jgi:hypothetical protein